MRAPIAALSLVLLLPCAAVAQIPAGPGQQPGTLPPAPAVVAPPPLAIPAPVPPSVTLQPPPPPGLGPPSGTYREPTYGSSTLGTTIRTRPPKKRSKKPRKYRGSAVLFVRQA
jgi:hypothetical protein